MVPPIKRPSQLTRRPRIPNNLSKVHGGIKRLPLPRILHNPSIHPHPRLLPRRIRVALSAPPKRCYRRAVYLEPGLLAVRGDLLVSVDEAVADAGLGARVGAAAADVVDAFEDEDVFDPGLGYGVALVAGEEGGAQAAGEDGVAACCLVVYGDVGDSGFLHAGEEEVGPALEGWVSLGFVGVRGVGGGRTGYWHRRCCLVRR